jgi:hypothetical protein
MKNTAAASWQNAIGVAQMVKMKGNFWKSMGFSINGKEFLYPEEALLLLEKNQIIISLDGHIIEKSMFYNIVLNFIPLPCYLTYAKLKVRNKYVNINKNR